MTARAKLSLVADEPLDITLALRADIAQRDWSRVHIAGDKAPPLPFFESVKRMWWK